MSIFYSIFKVSCLRFVVKLIHYLKFCLTYKFWQNAKIVKQNFIIKKTNIPLNKNFNFFKQLYLMPNSCIQPLIIRFSIVFTIVHQKGLNFIFLKNFK